MNLLIQHIQNLIQENQMFMVEKRKSFFNQELQEFWNQVLKLVLLCYIKHTNLLQLLKINKNQDLKFIIG